LQTSRSFEPIADFPLQFCVGLREAGGPLLDAFFEFLMCAAQLFFSLVPLSDIETDAQHPLDEPRRIAVENRRDRMMPAPATVGSLNSELEIGWFGIEISAIWAVVSFALESDLFLQCSAVGWMCATENELQASGQKLCRLETEQHLASRADERVVAGVNVPDRYDAGQRGEDRLKILAIFSHGSFVERTFWL
jgi:hypothetical protein